MRVIAFASLAVLTQALDNGLLRTPPLGWNSWNCYGAGVTAQDLRNTADQFISLGLAAAGYEYVSTDDGWMNGRDPVTNEILADAGKFPGGLSALADYIHSKGLKFGLYSAASSVVCSGRVGSLYHEALDAGTFAKAGVDFIKYDNCGEYGLGDARFVVFADAANATGRPMAISTEPFSLQPNPAHKDFANMWRTTNDINANYETILDRADTNDKWAPLAEPGAWNDPDMLEVGNGGLTDAESRTHFGLWALMKSPLILGTPLAKLSASQLAIVTNAAVIAVNQDALGVQGRKLYVGTSASVPTPRFVGVIPCADRSGYNGASAAALIWTPLPFAGNASAVMLFNNDTSRCLAVGNYFTYATAPVLLPCNASDAAQAWLLPTGAARLGALLSLAAVLSGAPAALTVGDSTLYAAAHGTDTPLPDANYGLVNVTLTPYAPEPPCNSRACDNYEPGQMWYWSPRDKRIHLGHFSANDYHCMGPNCYQLTRHLPTSSTMCLAHVLSFDGNTGTDPYGSHTSGQDVWGGPLAGSDGTGGAYVLAIVNRNATASATVTARWSMLEVPGVGDTTSFCVQELFTNTSVGVRTGSVTATVPPHDIALYKLVSDVAC